MKKETPSSSMPKLIVVVVLIVCIGVAFGLIKLVMTEKPTEVETPKVEISKDVTKDKTDNWKTYRNEKYGFELKYPEDAVWYFKSNDPNSPMSYLVFNKSVINFLVVPLNNWKNIKSLDNFYYQIVFPSIKNKAKNYSTLEISGYKAIKYIDSSDYSTVAIIKGGNLYRFWHSRDDLLAANVFNQILSTFRFIENTEAGSIEVKNAVI